MSWEVWGSPPDPEPTHEPDPGYMVPPIGPGQQWCCSRGCGVCQVKTVPYVWREVHDRNGTLIERNSYPVDMSSCCSADLMLWDEDKQDCVAFEMLERKVAG